MTSFFDDDFDLDSEAENLKMSLQQVLDSLLTAEDTPISISHIYRLSDLPQEELAQFVARFPSLPVERREALARHMADISEENFQVDYSLLTPYLLQDPSAEVRKAALDALWDSSNISLIDLIIRTMETDPSMEVRTVAAATLGHYVLMAQWKELPPRIEKPIVDALLRQLNQPNPNPSLWRVALESFAGSSHPQVNNFIERAYEQRDDQTQISAVFAMGRSADRRWLITVQDEMQNDDPQMRAEAARAAGAFGASDPVEQLIELAHNDEDLEVRLAAVHALGQIGGAIASEALGELAEDPEAEDLYDAIEEALDEMMWLGGEIDLSLLNLDPSLADDDDEDDYLDLD